MKNYFPGLWRKIKKASIQGTHLEISLILINADYALVSYLTGGRLKFQLLTIYFNRLKNKNKKASLSASLLLLAEREGFEPPDPFRSTVFKTAAIDHSAISPSTKVQKNYFPPNLILKSP